MNRVLNDLQARWGPLARAEHAKDWALPEPPPWIPKDPLRALWKDHARLLATGEITWGRVVMANRAVWEPGPYPHPALIAYSFDPWFQRDPTRLNTICDRVFDLRNAPLAFWPAERHIQELVCNDHARYLAQPLPPSLAMGRAVDISTTILFREHLTGGHLRSHLLPVLVSRVADPPSCLVVPASLWWTPLH